MFSIELLVPFDDQKLSEILTNHWNLVILAKMYSSWFTTKVEKQQNREQAKEKLN